MYDSGITGPIFDRNTNKIVDKKKNCVLIRKKSRERRR